MAAGRPRGARDVERLERQGHNVIGILAGSKPTSEAARQAAERLRKELGDWFGDVASWRLLRSCSIPRALPVVDTPSQDGIESKDGLVHCGDYLSNASINGAMASGRAAADHVIASRAVN